MSSNTHPSDEIVADDMSIPAQAKPRHCVVMMTGPDLQTNFHASTRGLRNKCLVQHIHKIGTGFSSVKAPIIIPFVIFVLFTCYKPINSIKEICDTRVHTTTTVLKFYLFCCHERFQKSVRSVFLSPSLCLFFGTLLT